MILRLLIAIIGAGLVTVTMLYGMSEFTAMFRQRGTDKFFLITDILPRPDPGRPARPPAAALPPARTSVEYAPGEIGIQVEIRPEADAARVSPEAVPPALEDTPAPKD